MTKDEFIKACHDSGYCKKEIAVKYAKQKETFTSADFENVFRLNEKKELLSSRLRYYQGARSTKHFKYKDNY